MVDLEAIHEHFKVCLADPGVVDGSSSSNGTAKDASNPQQGQQEGPPPTVKKRRLVGTSVKGARSSSRK